MPKPIMNTKKKQLFGSWPRPSRRQSVLHLSQDFLCARILETSLTIQLQSDLTKECLLTALSRSNNNISMPYGPSHFLPLTELQTHSF